MDKELTVEEKRQELISFCKQQKRHGGCGTCPLYEDAEPCEVCGFDDRQVFSDQRIVRLYSRLCETPVNYTLADSNARDVVEVVRCKDCKYWKTYRCACYHILHTSAMDYCFFGAKMDGDEND